MEFVIGEEIRKKVEEKGITLKSFAAAIGMTPRNLDRFFERKDVSMRQLVVASEVLDFDFVTLYLENANKKTEHKWLLNDPESVYLKRTNLPVGSDVPKQEISFQLNIKGSFDKIQKEIPDFMKIIKEQAELRGLHLG